MPAAGAATRRLLLAGASLAGALNSPADRAAAAFRTLLRGAGPGEDDFWQDSAGSPRLLRSSGRSFRHLFSSAALNDVINPKKPHLHKIHRGSAMTYGDAIILCRTTAERGREDHQLMNVSGVEANGSKVRELYQSGWTVVLKDPARFIGPITEFTALLEQHTMMPLSSYLFLTPPGCQGFDFHYDSVGSFHMQVEGSKRWTLFPPTFEEPVSALRSNRMKEADLPAEALGKRQEFVQREGDVFWIPCGWHHTAKAEGLGGSVHLALLLERVLWLEVIKGLNLEGQTVQQSSDDPTEAEATAGVPLALRRRAPAFLHRLPDFALARAMQAAAREAGLNALEVLAGELEDWRADFFANLTAEVLPPHAAFAPAMLEGLPVQRPRSEVVALGLVNTTRLRVTSTNGARLVNTVDRSSRGRKWAIVKYSGSPQGLRGHRVWLVPEGAARALRQILHVERNPSGLFTPSDIAGVSQDLRMQLARGLVERRIAVTEAEWLSMGKGLDTPGISW